MPDPTPSENENSNPEVDALLSGIEVDAAVARMNVNDLIVQFPDPATGVPQFMPIQIHDFTILPDGSLMLYRAYARDGKVAVSVCNVFASGQWTSFERVQG